MKKVLSLLALVGLFVVGVVAGDLVAPDLSHSEAQTTQAFCEEDKCEPAPWWKVWADDRCVMNSGYPTGCDVIEGGCRTYSCTGGEESSGVDVGEDFCDESETEVCH